MAQAYVKTTWVPGGAPGISATRLNNLETGIFLASAPLVTTLPTSPVDGQECNFLADATNGVVWHLVYRAATGKWLFTGGAPLTATQPDAGIAAGSGVWSGLASPLQIVAPLAGDYMVRISAAAYMSNMGSSNPVMYTGLSVGGAAPASSWQVGAGFAVPAGQQTWPGRDFEQRYNGVAAAAVLQAQHQWTGAAPPLITTRYMSAYPVRVG